MQSSTEALLARFQSVGRWLSDYWLDGRRILVVSHIDADGICSGSIAFTALVRKGANVSVRCIPELDPATIAGLASQRFDLCLFTDLGSSLVKELDAALGGKFVVVDHHQITEEDLRHKSVVNAWGFGLDGGKEACSSTMAYFFARTLDPANRDLAPLAVIGAVADRQDGGSARSLTGLNQEALNDTQSGRAVTVTEDLLFTGRETRPIHESVALTTPPFIRGVTGNRDGVLAALHQSGMRLQEGRAWRSVSSLSPEERMKLTEVLAGLAAGVPGATASIAGLVGTVYTLEGEDPFTPLRDAREFATLLNACGRMGRAGVGIAICLGDRGSQLASATDALSEYRSGLGKALSALSADRSRIELSSSLVIVRGEGLVEDRLLGPVISIMAASPDNSDKVVIGFADSDEESLKVSSRVGDAFPGEVNLAAIMRSAAEAVGGVGGGHEMAAGAKIARTRRDEFRRLVEEAVGV